MTGRMFPMAAGVSLLMLVAVCGMWVRSHWVRGLAHHGTPMIVAGDAEWLTYQTLQSCGGGVEYMRLKAFAERGRIRHDTPVGWGYGRFARKDGEAAIGGTTLGFRVLWEHRPISGKAYHHVIVLAFPYWAPAALLAVLPSFWVIDLVRRRRRGAAGLCVACGYDLRATAGRCPECGASPAGHR